MNSKKENNHGIIIWLQRIFSLKFLGFVIGLVSLYFTYVTFIKDNPGDLCLYNIDHTFNKDIRYIFYGFEIDDDSIYFNKRNNFPKFVNNGPNEIIDFGLVAETKLNYSLTANSYYDYDIEEEEEGSFSNVRFALTTERLGFMSTVPFPIDALETNDAEIQFNYINSGVIYKGMSEDIINYFYYIVGVPKNFRDEKGIEISAEETFINKIKPYLLYFLDNRDKNEILIIFSNDYVEAPAKLKLLRENNKVTSIKDLQ